MRAQVVRIVGSGEEVTSGQIPFTPRAKKVLELSLREALQLGHNYIGTEHILLGLIREGEGVATQVFHKLGCDLSRVRQTVLELMSGWTEVAESSGGEEIGVTTEVAAVPRAVVVEEGLGDDTPTCPNCFASLDETLAVKILETTADDEPFSVKIAYCSRCGVALGAVT